MPDDKFEFRREDDGSLSLHTAVHQAIGAASVCWESMEGSGVFKEDTARRIANALIDYVETEWEPAIDIVNGIQDTTEFDKLNKVDPLYCYRMAAGALKSGDIPRAMEWRFLGNDLVASTKRALELAQES